MTRRLAAWAVVTGHTAKAFTDPQLPRHGRQPGRLIDAVLKPRRQENPDMTPSTLVKMRHIDLLTLALQSVKDTPVTERGGGWIEQRLAVMSRERLACWLADRQQQGEGGQ